jgi:hypothetical protein
VKRSHVRSRAGWFRKKFKVQSSQFKVRSPELWT